MQVRREHLLELGQRPQRGLLDAGDATARRRGTQADRDRDGLFVVEQQRRQRRPGAEPIPARDTGRGIHRIPERAQPVTSLRTVRVVTSKRLGELRPVPLAPRLQQREQAKQPGRRLEHPHEGLRRCGTERSAWHVASRCNMTDIHPFQIDDPDADLEDLRRPARRRRAGRTRSRRAAGSAAPRPTTSSRSSRTGATSTTGARRSAAERVPAVHDHDRRTADPLRARPLSGAGRAAVADHPRLPVVVRRVHAA